MAAVFGSWIRRRFIAYLLTSLSTLASTPPPLFTKPQCNLHVLERCGSFTSLEPPQSPRDCRDLPGPRGPPPPGRVPAAAARRCHRRPSSAIWRGSSVLPSRRAVLAGPSARRQRRGARSGAEARNSLAWPWALARLAPTCSSARRPR